MDTVAPAPFSSVLTGITAMFLATSYRLLPNIITDHTNVDKMGELNAQYYNSFIPEEYDFIVGMFLTFYMC